MNTVSARAVSIGSPPRTGRETMAKGDAMHLSVEVQAAMFDGA